MTKSVRPAFAAAALAAAAWLAAAGPAAAGGAAQKLIDDSATMLRAFAADAEAWSRVQPFFRHARAVVLAPDVLEAGLFVGASGGQCVMIARGPRDSGWSPPSFCTLTEASVGLQIGFRKSETLLLAMTDTAAAALMAGTVQVGGETGVAAGYVGRGEGVKGGSRLSLEVDLIVVSRSQGLFGGVSVDGSWIAPDNEFNAAWYGGAIAARDILVERIVAVGAADALIRALEEAEYTEHAYNEAH